MKRVEFEAGVVYERKGQLYLAVGPRLLLGREGGEWTEHRPYVRYRAHREMSVAELRERWEVDAASFDAAVSGYFKPSDEGGRIERSARRRSWSDGHWRAFRTFRHSLERRAG